MCKGKMDAKQMRKYQRLIRKWRAYGLSRTVASTIARRLMEDLHGVRVGDAGASVATAAKC